jgi:hypothetical protein
MFIEEEQLPQGADLALAVQGGAILVTQRVILDPIYFGDHARNLSIEVRRHLSLQVPIPW